MARMRNARRFNLTIAAVLASAIGTMASPGYVSPVSAGGIEPPANQAQPSASGLAPIPDTDPGGHRAQIWGHAYTANGLSIVSVSSDRTLRVWSTETGQSRVIRGMRGADSIGKLFALAVSPDNKTAAIGGALGSGVPAQGDIRLVDLTSGEQIGRLSGHKGFVRSLAFSQDGKWLASGDSQSSVKVWSMTDRREVGHADNKVKVKNPRLSKAITKLGFVDADHIVAAAQDGLRIFERGSLTLKTFIESNKAERALTLSKDGTMIAFAGEEGTVRVLSWPGLETRWELATGREILDLAFGSGAAVNRLAVASGQEPYIVTVWDVANKTHTATYEGHDNIAQGVVFSPDGSTIASVGGDAHGIHLWSLAEAESTQRPVKAKRLLQGGGRTVWSVGFLKLPDGTQDAGTYLAWGYETPCYGIYSCPEELGPLSHAIRIPDERLPVLGDPFALIEAPWTKGKIAPIEHRAIFETPTGRVRGEKQNESDKHFPRLTLNKGDGATQIGMRDRSKGEEYTSYSFDPSGSWIVSGGRNNKLETIALDGTSKRQLQGHDGTVDDVAVSPDGRFIASASNDQTVRLWNSETGELIVSLLHLPVDERWIMWTPQGYFGAAPASEDLIGWHIDRGPDESADFVTAGEVRTIFHNRELVSRAIVLASAEGATAEFRAAGRLPDFSLGDLRHRSPPDLRVLEPRNPFDPNAPVITKSGWINVVLALVENTDDIEKFEVWVNGNQVVEKPTADVVDITRRRVTLEVPLFADYNNVVIMPKTKTRPQRDWRIPVRLDAKVGPLDIRDQAYVVAIGVNGYTAARPLSFARDDAAEFALAMDSLLKKNHPNNRVRPIVLVDGGFHEKLDSGRFDVREPTRANIVKALDVFRSAGKNDTIILFLAGHGTNRTSHAPGFVFLPVDANKDAKGYTEASTLAWSTFQAALDAGKGRKIIFLDACRSAHLFDFGLTSDLVDRNLAVYSSTRPLEDALERKPHGEFTGAVLTGLAGEANEDKSAELEFDELGRFVRMQVRKRTGNQQTPTHYAPLGMTPFPVVRY